MSAWRQRAIGHLAVTIVVAHLAAMIWKIDEWPLSNYSMFSSLMKGEVRRQMVYGVTVGGGERMLRADAYFAPLGVSKLSHCLNVANRADEKLKKRDRATTDERLPKVARSLLDLYDDRREKGLHHGPELIGLRLYEVRWRIDPKLANLDHPEHRKLVAEYVVDQP
ncbi:MAG: hypothetical protein SFU86_00420 [Pirellulaceae bacterium]|nr:hypothetical protein [Pirellulaceae bacterium]